MFALSSLTYDVKGHVTRAKLVSGWLLGLSVHGNSRLYCFLKETKYIVLLLVWSMGRGRMWVVTCSLSISEFLFDSNV